MEGRGQKLKNQEGANAPANAPENAPWVSRSSKYTSTSGLVNRVTQSLRAVYDDVLNEPIPVEFADLLGRLEEAEKKNGSGQ